MIVRYIRNKKRQKLGVFVAEKKDDKIFWGYSVCHSKKDIFNADWGKKLATLRMNKRKSYQISELPQVVRQKLPYFLEGCRKYFRIDDFGQTLSEDTSDHILAQLAHVSQTS